ncbi:hypothetical protein OG497_30170 [Streptomyces sp. NBC_01242]|uniref:restriction system modified-DNA reader domain-containing protein n=1 Tax=Streptomyces sp. NBC_01242 TaxID=2903795 RepID=UPI002250578E|nr:hypothetical protein [Streptomyces sp. NBC_01242]MCX4798232.1 hypothetical protein [Streptomyces sp. NBC_01242]
MSRTIRVDDDVFARLQSLAEPFTDTPNSVIRRLLGLADPSATQAGRPASPVHSPADDSPLAALITEGRLHVGQRLVWRRRNLKQVHHAVVVDGGGLRLDDGSVHATPSSAATALAGNQQNGWKVFATEDGTLLKDLR